MQDFSTALLREKFTIYDPEISPGAGGMPVVAVSNRIVVELKTPAGKNNEVFILRAQNMHSALRMAARLLLSFRQGGPILNRHMPFDWETAWDSVVNDYEYAFNPGRWIAVYHNGKPIYHKGERHPFLDVIEKCNLKNKGQYEESIKLAEDAFKQTGKVVKIEYDGNVALVADFKGKEARIGNILRAPGKTTTFNITIKATPKNALNIPQCLGASAAFLEGIQLAYQVGMGNEKIRAGLFKRHSKEEKQNKEAARRLGRLSAEIANLESAFDVRYRPEKPEFHKIVPEAEANAHKMIEDMLARGDLDEDPESQDLS